MKKDEEAGAFGFIGCKSEGEVRAQDIMAAFTAAGYRSQPVKAEIVFGRAHLVSACLHAERALRRGTSASEDIMTEIALYLGCSSQLSRALSLVKIDGEKELVVITTPSAGEKDVSKVLKSLGLRREDSLIELTKSKAAGAGLLGIDSVDVDVVREAVLEKVAFVDMER